MCVSELLFKSHIFLFSEILNFQSRNYKYTTSRIQCLIVLKKTLPPKVFIFLNFIKKTFYQFLFCSFVVLKRSCVFIRIIVLGSEFNTGCFCIYQKTRRFNTVYNCATLKFNCVKNFNLDYTKYI
jgi:hypothetical protein